VKNGAELLDRLIKDIVAEKASNYVSVANPHRLSGDQEPESSAVHSPIDASYDDLGAPAFSLPKFVPLLAERIYTLNPFTRMFLVNWISVLDSIPDLELISYLPAFLKGLMQYLADNNEDVRIATQQTMNGFLQDIRRTTDIKKVLKDRRRMSQVIDESDSASGNSRLPDGPDGRISPIGLTERLPEDFEETDDWVPGQDVRIDYAEIINILIPFLRERGLSSFISSGLFFR
jgi:vacuole morphology and inheritance protein 14